MFLICKKLFYSIVFLSFIFSLNVHAQFKEQSLRRCTLLPVIDNVDGTYGIKIFERVESYLKNTSWCTFVTNADFIHVFAKYRSNLKDYLKDPEVLGVIADKLKTGSNIIIQTEVKSNRTVDITVEVLGGNKGEVLFSESTTVSGDQPDFVFETVKNFLELYETSIPYDGVILGAVGEQVNLSYSGKKIPVIGQEFHIKRLVKKNYHPLLKKVVGFDLKMIAKGKVFSIDSSMVLGKILLYKEDTTLKVGDYVSYDQNSMNNNEIPPEELEPQDYGKLGMMRVNLVLDSHSVGTNKSSSKKIGSFIFGVNAMAEAWITRNLFVMGEFTRSSGSLAEISGDVEQDPAGTVNTHFKFGGGYKYLPLQFFYGPQVNFYAGYARYSYALEESVEDGFTATNLSGLFFGFGGSIPFFRDIRGLGRLEVIPFPTFTEDGDMYSQSATAASSMLIEAGVTYIINPSFNLYTSYEMHSAAAKFTAKVKEITYRDNSIKVGLSVDF